MARQSSRKCRINNKKNKKKKPKFLSLRLQLSPEKTREKIQMRNSAALTRCRDQELNLNLYPQNPAEDEAVAADFFAAAVDGGAATLTALLGGDSPLDGSDTLSPSLTMANDAQDSVSPSYADCAQGSEESALLVRTAMRRSKGKDASEEKWVCYEEVTSCAADLRVKVHPQGLSLKLDYQDIMDAWSDKGPLHVAGPQMVPEFYDDFFYGLNDGRRSNGALWTVPEMGINRAKGEQELEEEQKIQHREASVLRYKEKRQNRLFSKRIRYEVRKINAEKRPRMKGRFVKRS